MNETTRHNTSCPRCGGTGEQRNVEGGVRPCGACRLADFKAYFEAVVEATPPKERGKVL